MADHYYAEARYAQAAELYGPMVDKSTDTPLLRRYLTSLFNGGSYGEALTLARDLRGTGPVIPLISEIEALELEYIGDLEHARDLRLQLIAIEPKNISHRIGLVKLDLRRGDDPSAREVLEQIRFGEIKNNAEALMRVAGARALLGLPDVLPMAYRARRLDFGNPEMHLAYIGLFLQRETRDQSLLDAAEVGVDCTVHLVRNGERKTFTIVNEVPADRRPGELVLTEAPARKLLGRHRGDQVLWKEGPIEELTYEIADIQSKYVFAFQETMNEFSTWFPENQALHRVEMSRDDHSKVFFMLDARQRQSDQILALYRKGDLTLGAAARLMGKSLVSAWGNMVSRGDGQIIATRGTPEDQRQEAVLLSTAETIVMDLTALLTLAHLKLLDQLPRRFRRIVVPRAVLDDLHTVLVSDFSGPAPVMTTWKEGDTYYRQDITPEDMARGRTFLEGIQTFIESTAEVVATSKALELGQGRFEHLKDLLGHGEIAAVLVAKAHEALLYSDDLMLRAIANNDWQVKGVWSQTVLLALRDQGILSKDEYHEAVKNLAAANYHYVSINAADLIWIVKQYEMKTTPEMMRLFALLHGPGYTDESAVRVTTEFIRGVWFDCPFDYQKQWILELALNALTTGRSCTIALQKFKAVLRARFALAPLALQELLRMIDHWDQQRLLREGMLQ